MTVICTLINKYSTVHVTDSHQSIQTGPKQLKVVEREEPKVVHVPKFKGGFSYFGLAEFNGFDTYKWLNEMANQSKDWDENHPEKFADYVTEKLNDELKKLGLHGKIEGGIGIHFTAYEPVAKELIPEMFFITNWRGNYVATAPEVIMQRQTYHTIKGNIGPQPEQREHAYRMAVQAHLNDGRVIMYNNGDPVLFNSAAYALFNMVQELADFGVVDLKDPIEHYDKLALMPVQTVGTVQREFCKPDFRPVGGNTHILTIKADGSAIESGSPPKAVRSIPEQGNVLAHA